MTNLLIACNLNMVSGQPSPSISITEVDDFPKKTLLRCSTRHVPKESLSPYNHVLYGVFGYPQEDKKVGKRHQAEMPPMMSISNYCNVQKNPHYQDPLKELAIPLTLGHGIHENRGKGHYLVPGYFRNPWDKKEEDIFILGLYICGKDFDKVKKFIGNNKTMREILSFYYEKSCKSVKHRRWKQWWQKPEKPGIPEKPKSVKRVFGENIFQQPSRLKLLSRVKHIVPIECYFDILETIWLYEESKVTFEECVLKLMDYVELNILVEAIGIGKGEEDLTVIISEEKSTNVRKVPNGKDCSMLTHREIVNILSSFTLRKPRSKNLFWEAVWPRLLARGWRFEKQQGTHNYATKMFFFAPGVEHFSEKLEKGKHYFDSTGDVLEMVSLNPEMIELPTVEKNGSGEAVNLEEGNLSDGMKLIGYIPDNVGTQEEQGNGTNGKKLVIGEEVMPSGVNTKITNTRTRVPSTKMLDALESEEYHPTIENRKRKNSPHGSSVPMSSGYSRAKLADESSHDNTRGF